MKKLNSNAIRYLPRDLLIPILYQLPVRSLIRFQCVCKDWRELICSDSFKVEHYNLTASRSDGLLFIQYVQGPTSLDIGMDVYPFVFMDDTLRVVKHVDFPSLECPKIVAVCNGVVCIYFTYSDRFILWNPALKEFNLVPQVPSHDPQKRSIYDCGFGFVPRTVDFKVVRIFDWYEEEKEYELIPKNVQVYSLRSNRWRTITPSVEPITAGYSFESAYAYGACHWVVYRDEDHGPSDKEDRSILSFDFDEEVFYWMSFPEVPPRGNGQDRFTTLKDCLALICSTRDGIYQVWLRIGNHVQGSWRKQYSLFVVPKYRYPLSFWKNAVLFTDFRAQNIMFRYFHTEEVEKDAIFLGRWRLHRAFVYKESLFSIKQSKL